MSPLTVHATGQKPMTGANRRKRVRLGATNGPNVSHTPNDLLGHIRIFATSQSSQSQVVVPNTKLAEGGEMGLELSDTLL